MIDQKTTNFQLPLPHPNNQLEEDVLRLRTAFTNVDGLLWLLNQGAARIFLPVTATVAYDQTGRMATVTEDLGTGLLRTTGYTYDQAGNLATETVTIGSVSRQTLFSYDQAGRMTGWTTSELAA